MARGYDSGVLRQIRTVFSVGAVGGLTDGQLLERFLCGPAVAAEAGFAALVERHGPMVLSVCRGVLKNPHDAEDAFQATFLVLARKAGSIRTRDSMSHWLYGVARRVAIRAKMQEATRRKVWERRAAERATEWVAADELEHDDFSMIHEEIDRLDEKHRAPVILCYLEGMSYETAARCLRVTEGTVRGRLARARELLRTRLTRRGLAFSAGAGLLAEPLSARALAAVPRDLLDSTVQAAIGFASGKAATSAAISASVVAMTEGGLNAMRYYQLKTIGSAVLALGVLGFGAGVWAQQDTGAEKREDRSPDMTVLPSVVQAKTDQAQQGGDKIDELLAASVPGPAAVLAQQGTGAEKGDDRSRDATVLVAAAQAEAKQAEEGGEKKVDEQLAAAVPGRIVRSSPISKDCMVLSYIPDWAFGNVDNIGIANNDGGVRTYLNWPSIPAKDASSPDRRFLIALYSRKTEGPAEAGPIHAYEVQQEWVERTSWKTQPDCDRKASATYQFAPGDGWKLFDVTPLVQAQARSGRNGYGVLLRFETESFSGATQAWSGYQFVSREGEKEWASRRPQLLVVEPKGK